MRHSEEPPSVNFLSHTRHLEVFAAGYIALRKLIVSGSPALSRFDDVTLYVDTFARDEGLEPTGF